MLWGTADGEIKVLSVENPELLKVLPNSVSDGHDLAMHALPTARISTCLISTLLFQPTFFLFSNSFPFFLY